MTKELLNTRTVTLQCFKGPQYRQNLILRQRTLYMAVIAALHTFLERCFSASATSCSPWISLLSTEVDDGIYA